MLKVSFSTLGCPDWGWHDVLRRGAAFGYDGVEIRLLRRETDLLSVAELRPAELASRRRELTESGFRVCGLASSVRFDEPEQSRREARLEDGRRYIDLARELGAEFVRVFGDTLPADGGEAARIAAIDRIADCMNRLGEEAARAGVGIVIETHGDFADSTNMAELRSRIASPAVGVLWDTHHPWRFYGEPLDVTFGRLAPWIRHTHWKDSVVRIARESSEEIAAASALAHATNSGHKPADYVLFGGGQFPAAECLRLLLDAGYDGWHSLEWEKMWHPQLDDPEVALPLFPGKLRQLARFVADASSQ